jgi:hypothetical protein
MLYTDSRDRQSQVCLLEYPIGVLLLDEEQGLIYGRV